VRSVVTLAGTWIALATVATAQPPASDEPPAPPTDTATAETTSPTPPTPAPLPPSEPEDDAPRAAETAPDDGIALALGPALGASIQTDQLVAGLSFAVRGLGVSFVEIDARLLAGLGGRYAALRAGLDLSLALAIDPFRIRALIGAAVARYEPIGDFAQWCDKTDVACGQTAGGLELGLGVGWSFLSLDAILGAGELPRFLFLLGASVVIR
jgi:hypothetical protein